MSRLGRHAERVRDALRGVRGLRGVYPAALQDQDKRDLPFATWDFANSQWPVNEPLRPAAAPLVTFEVVLHVEAVPDADGAGLIAVLHLASVVQDALAKGARCWSSLEAVSVSAGGERYDTITIRAQRTL